MTDSFKIAIEFLKDEGNKEILIVLGFTGVFIILTFLGIILFLRHTCSDDYLRRETEKWDNERKLREKKK